MKYIIFSIKSDDCEHKMFGISCKRNVELMEQLDDVVGKLEKMNHKGHGIENTIRECLMLAKNDQETLYLSFYFGQTLQTPLDGIRLYTSYKVFYLDTF